MKIFDMDTMEGVSGVIRPWFRTFLCEHLLWTSHGLKYNSMSMPTRVFTSMGEFLVVDRIYRSYVVFLIGLNRLGKLDYFRHHIFGVVLEKLKYSSGSTCTILLMKIYRRATMCIYSCPIVLLFILLSRSRTGYVWLNVRGTLGLVYHS